ncbi:MAG: CHAP domain-containing protein [Candidatus Saccharimonadales bacterium]
MNILIHQTTLPTLRKVALLWVCIGIMTITAVTPAFAVELPTKFDTEFFSGNNLVWYDPTSSGAQQACQTTNNSSTKLGTDYTGKEVLSSTQKDAILKNQSVYEQAAKEVDIPWQMLAVIHLRETNLGRSNPSNGQGIYQFLNKGGGPYPTGSVSDAEFLRQTVLAAKFLKNAAKGNVSGNQNLTSSSDQSAIKDTFFSYNGRASKYAQQAAALGYSKEKEPYEGSPYVMNIADSRRDPAVNKTTWGQVKRDHGPIEYPANGDYGAFVVYASLAGVSASSCSSSSLNGTSREKVVTIAKQEAELWKSGEMKGNGVDFQKYTNKQQGNWCAWFVSWVYNEAGMPLVAGGNGAVAAVDQVRAIGNAGDKFEWKDRNGYTPVPGDIVILKETGSHTNIVTAVSGDKVTIVGGNQGYGDGGVQATSFKNSEVTEFSFSLSGSDGYLNKITGYVVPKG